MKLKSGIPPGAKAIVEQCKKGQILCKTLCKEVGRADVAFTLEPSGKRVNRVSALQAIESGKLIPHNDGLFGPADAQSWGAA